MLGLAGCGGGSSRAPLRQLPVQLGRAAPATPTPPPTATPIAPPPCSTPVAEFSNVRLERGPSPETHLITGQVKSGCSVAVDLTLGARWLDGADRQDGARAFATLRRLQPGESRPFSEVVSGGRGATRPELSATAAHSVLGRRR
jgi:hypothetical protein